MYVDFLGSDTHGMDFRPLHVDRAMAWMNAEVRPELRRRIMTDNIRLLLGQRAGAAGRT